MARREEEQENYWPGFVDALSTIIMVVTFIMIILGILIFALSQQVAKEKYVADVPEETIVKEEKKQESPETQSADIQQQSVDIQQQSADIQQQSADTKQQSADTKQQSADNQPQTGIDVGLAEGKQSGKFKINAGQALFEDDKNKNKAEHALAVRSQQTIEQKAFTVTSDEVKLDKNKKSVEIRRSTDLLNLNFLALVSYIDEDTAQKAGNFLKENMDAIEKAEIVEIWAFANVENTGVSAARRLAYFRGMSMRNIILRTGVEAEKINLRVRETDDAKLADTVKVILK